MHRSFLYPSFAGCTLLLLISVPTFVPALHELLHYHQHFHCSAAPTDIHLHANVYDCELCNYLTTLTYMSDAVIALDYADEPHAADCITSQKPLTQIIRGLEHLRGPPAGSV